MNAEYGEFVGVEDLHVAEVLTDTAETYAAETPIYLAPASEVSAQANINNAPQYYDNVAGFNYVSEGVTTITLTISGIPQRLLARLLGKYYDATTGRVLDNGQPNPPMMALSFSYNKGPGGKVFYQYLNGTFSGGEEVGTTKADGNVTVHTYQLTYTALNTTHMWSLGGELTTLKRATGDTTDPNFTGTAATWFAQVQTPATSQELAKLSALSIGSLTLTPSFSAGTLHYTAGTTNASDAVTATAASGDAAAIKINGAAHTSGTAATWAEGENIVEVTVTSAGKITQIYNVTVTAS